MNLSTWSIRNPIPVILLFGLLTICGLLSFHFLPIQNFPDIDLPVIRIAATLEGASPAQLETEVARKIEDRLASLSRLDHISTTITDGSVAIMVLFEMDKDPEVALNEVRNAVDGARNDLPPAMTPPNISRQTTQDEVLVTYTVNSEHLDEVELSWLVDNELTKALLSAKGVGEINRLGGVDREIHVDLDPETMMSLGVTAGDVSAALHSVQVDLSGGRGKVGRNRQTIRTLGARQSTVELAGLSIPVRGGTTVRLEQIARVSDDSAERSSLAYRDGKPVIALQIKRSNGFSDLTVMQSLRKAVAAFGQQHPEARIEEAATTVQPTIDNYEDSMRMLYEGAAITILVVWLFLRNGRATWLSAIALPLSILPAFLVMHLAGYTLNIISLVSLSLVVGILVDDAIVEIENIIRHSRMGKAPGAAALAASNEIGLAVVATTLTLVAVFLPTSFMSGISGFVFRQFGVTASAAVLTSLLVARMLTPMLAAAWLKPEPQKVTPDGPIMRAYMALVRKSLLHRKRTLAIVGAILITSLALTAFLNASFVPAADNAQTKVELTLQPGSSLQDTGKIAQEAASLIGTMREVKSVFVAVGMGGGAGGDGHGSPTLDGLNSAVLTVVLQPIAERKRSQAEVEQEIRRLLKMVAGVRVSVGDGGDGSTLTLTLASDDSSVLESTAALLETQLRSLRGIGNVSSSAALIAPEVQITPDFSQAAALGVTSEAMATAVRVATDGDYSSILSKLNLPERQIPIRVRFGGELREQLSEIAKLQLPGAKGAVSLGSVADIQIGGAPAIITRLDRARNVTLSVELNGRNIGEVMEEARRLPVLMKLPAGVSLVEQGEMEQITDMFRNFGIAMAIGVFCIYAVLVLLFRDFLQPVTILMAIPLSLGGALLPLVVTGSSFSMAAVIGVLMLMGIVTKNSILLVEYAIKARRNGIGRLEALLEACHKRSRPVLMTTLAMIGGMLPVVVGFSGGDPSFRRPMAIVVIGGLVASTFLSLVVIPVIFTVVDDCEQWAKRRLRGNPQKPAAPVDGPLSPVDSHTYYFETAPVPKAVAYMALPLILSMFVGVLYGIVDNLFIGMLGSADKIASAVLALPVFALFMGLANIFGIGCGSYISRLMGEKKHAEARQVSSFAFWSTIATGMTAALLCLILLDPLLSGLGTSAATRSDTRSFVVILAIGSMPIMASFCLGQIVRAEGRSKEAMIGMLLGILGNLALDPLFIFTFRWGVAGAACATVAGNTIAVVYYLWYFQTKSPHLSVRWRDFRLSGTIVRESLSIGVPVFFTGLLLMASAVCANNLAAAHGAIVVAIMGIAIQINNVPQFLISGLCEGVQPLLGYNYASGNRVRMRRVIQFAGTVSVVLGLVISVGLYVASRSVLGLFLHDSMAIETGLSWFRIAMLAQATYGGIYLFTSVFQAVRKAVPAFLLSISQGALFIPAVILGNRWFGVDGVAAALPISEAGTAFLGVALYLTAQKGIYEGSTPVAVIAPA